MNPLVVEKAQISQLDHRLHKVSLYTTHGLTALIVIIFFVHLAPFTLPYAFADDWTYSTPLKLSTVTEFLGWVFAQHVDHRIPLQKASSYLILRIAHFDFRYQVAFNEIVACLLTLMLLYVAREYRGHQSFGDLIIPLTTLSFAAGYGLWGMLGHFLLVMFFAVGFLTACAGFASKRRHLYLDIAAVCLILCALCGLQGMVISSVSSLVSLTWLLWRSRKEGAVVRISTYGLTAISLLLNLSLWIAWKPSAASHSSHSVSLLARFMYGLITSCFVTYSFTGTWWKCGIILVMLVLALFELGRRIGAGKLAVIDIAILAELLASLALLAAISGGRAAFAGGWSPTLAFHYGYLSILIPLLSWIVVSARLPLRRNFIASLAVVLLFGRSFEVNAKWRFDYVRQASPHQREVLADLQKPISAVDLADRHILDFYHVNTPETTHQVAEGIEAFRVAGASLYGKPVAGSAAKALISPPPAVSQLGTGACRITQLVGFQDVEDWGAWSREDPARIKLERALNGPLNVNFTAYAMNDHRPHLVKVAIGDETRNVSLTQTPQTFHLQYALARPVDEIVLSGIEPISPRESGVGLDDRKLAVGVVRVECFAGK